MNRSVFETTISQIMRQNQENTARPRQRSGLLDSGRLPFYKVTDRIFAKRAMEKKGKNYFISILMDASGSMVHGQRLKPCYQAVDKLAQSLQRVPGVFFEIVGFNGIEVKFKDYTEKYDPKSTKTMYQQLGGSNTSWGAAFKTDFMVAYNKETKEVLIGLDTEIDAKMKGSKKNFEIIEHDSAAAQNHDAFAVWNSFLRAKERTGRKILLVFSDGAPTFPHRLENLFRQGDMVTSINGDRRLATFISNVGKKEYFHPTSDLLSAAVQLSRRSEIDTVGMGIETNAVNRFYPNYSVINDAEDIFPETVKQLTKLFRKD